MDVQGPMARHVRDLRIALEAMSRPSPRDPWYVPVPLTGPPLPRPMKVAVVTDPAGGGGDPDVAAGVRVAAEQLAAAGYEVEEAEPPSVERIAELWGQVLGYDMRVVWPLLGPEAGDHARRFIALAFEGLPEVDQLGHVVALMSRQGLGRAWSEFQVEHPIVLGPVSTSPPFRVGTDLDRDGAAGVLAALRLVIAVNVLGLPSVAVPVGVAHGLPQAVQIIGPRFREDVCLDAADVIEDALGVLTPIDPR